MSPVTLTTMVLIWLFVILLDGTAAISRNSDIKLENNGYSDILLAFDDTIPHSPNFLTKTKEYFTQASKVLYNATRQRAFFKDITILVPHTWPDDPSYQSASVDQTLYKSDIIITSANPSVRMRSVPQTRSYGGCGSQGIHIQLTTDFLFKSAYPPYSRSPDKFLVHQWATFRWGVFQEYPSDGEPTFYFSTVAGRVAAVKCSLYLKGRNYVRYPNRTIAACQIDSNSGIYKDDCIYYAYPHYPGSVLAHVSMMDHQFIQEITGFCDDAADNQTKHNAEPLNRQNRLCSHRSTWDVITNTPDFAGGLNLPSSFSEAELVPRFTLIKAARTRRSAIILDKPDNGDINKSDVLMKMYQSVAHFVESSPDSDQYQFLVSNSMAKFLRASRVVRSTSGGTKTPFTLPDKILDLSNITKDCINRMFPQTTPLQKQVIVFSNNHSNIAKLRELKAANVTVHWVSLTQHPGTRNSGNEDVYFAHGHPESSSHLDAVYDVIQRTEGMGTYTIKLFSITKELQFAHEYRDTFSVDSSLHGDLTIVITYSGSRPLLELRSPTGMHYNEASTETSVYLKLKIIQVRIASEYTEKGLWEFKIRVNHASSTFSFVITSKSTPIDKKPPIQLKARLVLHNASTPPKMAVYADVTNGQHPVVGLTVVAKMFRPGTTDGHTPLKPYTMFLFDEGSGADIIKGDGIYSRYFPNLTGFGHYMLTVDILDSQGYTVTGTEAADKSSTGIRGISRSAYGGSVYIHADKTGDIKWVTSASGGNDVYPPSRIIDLNVIRKWDRNLTVMLSWTAPGGDLDHGTANRYEIKYGHSGLDLLKQKEDAPSVKEVAIVGGSTTHPLPAGRTEYLTIDASNLFVDRKRSFAFLLCAIDNAGNRGEFSNMVTVGFENIPDNLKTTQLTGNIEEADDSVSAGFQAELVGDIRASDARPWPLLFLNVILLVCFLLAALGFMFAYRNQHNAEPKYAVLLP